MVSPAYRVRRATVDDLKGLLDLWASMQFPVPELERRLTEFQLAESGDGSLLGAIALEINGRHGRIHSEAFGDFAFAETLRQHLWERVQSVATNHGLARLWTRETAPFWAHNGFLPAGTTALERLPEVWTPGPSGWLTLQLRDEEALEASLDLEFARFREEERQRTERIIRRGRALNTLATALALVLGLFVFVYSVYMLWHNPHLLGR